MELDGDIFFTKETEKWDFPFRGYSRESVISSDIAPLLTETNRTLAISNNQGSGWQKRAVCSVAYNSMFNPHDLEDSSVCSTHYKAPCYFSSGILIWMSYESTPVVPLICPQHGKPLYGVKVCSDRYNHLLIDAHSQNFFLSRLWIQMLREETIVYRRC